MSRLLPVTVALLLGLAPITGQSTGTLIILNKNANTASLVDLASLAIVATLPTGAGPHEAASSPDGNWAVVTNYGTGGAPGNSLTLINLANQSIFRTHIMWNYHSPHGIVYLPGDKVLVTAEAEQALVRVDLGSGDVEQVLISDQQMGHMVALTPDGNRAFVANMGSGSVTAFDLLAGANLGSIQTGAGAEGIDVDPSGSEVWVANRDVDTITILDAADLTVKDAFQSTGAPIRVKFTPDGQYVLLSNLRSGDVAVIAAATRTEVARIDLNSPLPGEPKRRTFEATHGQRPAPVGILIHPDGRTVYVATPNVDRVMVISTATWQVVARITTGDNPDGMAYSALVMK